MKLTPVDAPMRAKLRDVRDLQEAMRFARLNVRELSELCGSLRHRSSIGHLHAGTRNTCSIVLAGRIERTLRVHAGSLFTPVPRSVIVGATPPLASRKKAAA